MYLSVYVKYADSNLSIFQRLRRKSCSLNQQTPGARFRSVMSSVKPTMYCGLPAASLSSSEISLWRRRYRAVTPDEALFIFVRIPLSLNQFGVSFRSGSAFLRSYNLIPLPEATQLFSRCMPYSWSVRLER